MAKRQKKSLPPLPPDVRIVGDRMRTAIDEHPELNQTIVARRANYDQGNLSRFMSAKAGMSTHNFIRILQELSKAGVDIAKILTGEDRGARFGVGPGMGPEDVRALHELLGELRMARQDKVPDVGPAPRKKAGKPKAP